MLGAQSSERSAETVKVCTWSTWSAVRSLMYPGSVAKKRGNEAGEEGAAVKIAAVGAEQPCRRSIKRAVKIRI